MRLQEAIEGPPPAAQTQVDTASGPSFLQRRPAAGALLPWVSLKQRRATSFTTGAFTSSSAGGPCSAPLPTLAQTASPLSPPVTSRSPCLFQRGQNNSAFPRRVG